MLPRLQIDIFDMCAGSTTRVKHKNPVCRFPGEGDLFGKKFL